MTQLDFQLHAILLQLQNMAKAAPNPDMQKNIDDAITSLQEKRFRVAVLGDFKRGKSSLINALLGMPILPVDIAPTTATVNRITFGLQPEAIIHYKSGASQAVDIHKLSDFVTKLTQTSSQVAQTVREAEIRYPLVLCANNVDIIDTPGLNDTESMTAVVEDLLQNIDAAVFAVKATMPYSETECQWVTKLLALPNLQHVVFAVTCIDLLGRRDQQKMIPYLRQRISQKTLQMVEERYPNDPEILKKARRILAPEALQLYPVSSLKALEAFDTGDNDLLTESNLPTLKKELVTTLSAQQQLVELHRVKRLLDTIVPWLQGNAGFRERTLTAQKQIAALKREDALQKQFLQERQAQLQSICQDLDAMMDSLMQTWDAGALSEQIVKCYIRHLAQVTENSHNAIHAALNRADSEVKQNVVYPFGQQLRTVVNQSILTAAARYQNWRSQFLFGGGPVEEIAASFPKTIQFNAAVASQLSAYTQADVPETVVKAPYFVTGRNIMDLIRKKAADFSREYLARQKQHFPAYMQNAVFELARAEGQERSAECTQRIESRIHGLESAIAQTQECYRYAFAAYQEAAKQFETIWNTMQ